MRFKKGSKVEVLNNKEVPSGSWWCAEIISGNGHTYRIRYICCSPDMDGTVERVPRKAIRPSPPPVEGLKDWGVGDIVEVFEKNSWKLAEVSRVVDGNYFVRLLGSPMVFWAHISDLRVRQSWQDNKWVLIQKESGRTKDGLTHSHAKLGKCSPQIPQSCIELENFEGHAEIRIEDNNGFEEPVLRRSKKRPHLCLVPVATCHGASRKKRAVEKEEKRQRLIAGRSSRLAEKVDAVASPCKMLGGIYMHAPLNNAAGFCEMDIDRLKTHADVGYDFVRHVEANDSESVASSVGSCSPSYSSYRLLHSPVASPVQDLGSHSGDADASYASERELYLHKKERLEGEIHDLELHAYHSTMLALYSSGPLSWEQETLLTNLRLMLHISNDEHLSELRHLSSIGTNIHHSSQDVISRSL